MTVVFFRAFSFIQPVIVAAVLTILFFVKCSFFILVKKNKQFGIFEGTHFLGFVILSQELTKKNDDS